MSPGSGVSAGGGLTLSQGAFEPKKTKPGVTITSGIRLMYVYGPPPSGRFRPACSEPDRSRGSHGPGSLQLKAKHPETFTPHYISFTAEQYELMVRTFRLPFRAIEGTSVVGPFFWSAYDQDDDNPHLQIIFRKSDVRKNGFTRGWELMLSHEFRTGITTGYAKGTASSDMIEAVRHLRACAGQTGHPMLLPVIILSHDLSSKTDQKQRDVREWLRKLEHAVSMRNDIVESEGYVKNAVFDIEQITRDLVECHSQTLWKRPQAYVEIIHEMDKAMQRFRDRLPAGRDAGEIDRLHRSMASRLEFYHAKQKGIENYVSTTLARLDLQRSAVRTP